jgi:hypothetical protein
MAGQRDNPPGCGPAGFLNASSFRGDDGHGIAQHGFDGQAHVDISLAATSARVDLLRDDIADNAGAMIALLKCHLGGGMLATLSG